MTAPAAHQHRHEDPLVTLHRADDDADAILRARIAETCGVEEAAVRTGRLCPRCGSSAHGRPWARIDAASDIPVSISRSGAHLVTAVRREGPVGVDIESVAAVDRLWSPDLVLHPSERGLDRTPEDRARLWAGKEAVLKALGVGLGRAMPTIALADFDVEDLPAPPRHVIACARL